MSEGTRCYITKFALSRGIMEVHGIEEGGVVGCVLGGLSRYFYGEGREWHRTRESAVARAEKMRTRRIASLEKKIAQLKALSFEEAQP